MANIIYDKNIKHPNTFLYYSGETTYSKEVEAINQSIRLILTTTKGELFGDPNFGSMLKNYMFEFEGETLYILIKKEIVSCLTEQEPRIIIREEDISITDEGNKDVIIDISYNLKYTDYKETYRYIVNKKEKTNGYLSE